MASVYRPLSLRLGIDGWEALDQIARYRNTTRADAARYAIKQTAERESRRAGLAAEARALMQDPSYVSEMRDVASMMEDLRGSR